MGSESIKRARANMYKKNSYCPECGVKMILPEDLPKHKNSGKPTSEPDNMCTYEHIYSRLEDPKRKYNKRNRILCKKCNQRLGDKKNSELSQLEKWFRSGRWPEMIQWEI